MSKALELPYCDWVFSVFGPMVMQNMMAAYENNPAPTASRLDEKAVAVRGYARACSILSQHTLQQCADVHRMRLSDRALRRPVLPCGRTTLRTVFPIKELRSRMPQLKLASLKPGTSITFARHRPRSICDSFLMMLISRMSLLQPADHAFEKDHQRRSASRMTIPSTG